MEEIFKDIHGFEGLYLISSFGRIKSLGNGKSSDPRTKVERFLKTRIKNSGYEQVKLCKNGKCNHYLVHRLMAVTFIENRNNLPEINHIDGNKQNNTLSNLEWVSSSENQIHAFKLGLQKSIKGKDNKQSIPVLQLSKDGLLIKEWGSIKQIKREAGLNTYGIIGCCKNKVKYKTAYGFKWQYK